METIDWSKAPEGDTHYHRPNGHFYREIAGELMVFIDGEWQKSHLPGLSRERLIPRPATQPAWSGEGLPPVGVVCEVEKDTGRALWHKVKILYMGSEHAIVFGEHGEQHFLLRGVKFRPIRTPEQIAAHEKKLAVERMSLIVGDIDTVPTWTDALSVFYDAGLRFTK
jgi:hypothetical protein